MSRTGTVAWPRRYSRYGPCRRRRHATDFTSHRPSDADSIPSSITPPAPVQAQPSWTSQTGRPVDPDYHGRPADDQRFRAIRRAALDAFRQRNPHELLRIFEDLLGDEQMIASVPSTSISELFRLLEPDHFLVPFRDVHEDLTGKWVRWLHLQPIGSIFRKYFSIVERVAALRRRSGKPFGLTDFTFFLDCASAVGDGAAADMFWTTLKETGLNPDTTSFNHYMAAKCWAGLFSTRYRQRLRVQYYLSEERWRQRDDNMPLKNWPLRRKHSVARIYEEMIAQGIVGDERTFSTLIMATAREGDLESIGWILKSCWNIDVAKLTEPDRAPPPEPVRHYAKDSPLHPGPDLLFAVANAYGANNDVSTAFRLVDHLSRQYDIEIPSKVWSELLEWTYVLSIPRQVDPDRERYYLAGALPTTTIKDFWLMMTQEPYHVKPTMTMLNYHVRGLNFRRSPDQTLENIKIGRDLYRRSVETFERAQRRLQLLDLLASHGIHFNTPEMSIRRARRDLELARLTKARDHRWLSAFANMPLISGKYFHGTVGTRYERKALPDAIAELSEFMTDEIRFKSTAGWVQMNNGLRGDRLEECPEYDLVTLKPRRY